MNKPLQSKSGFSKPWEEFYDQNVLNAYEGLTGRAREIKNTEQAVLDSLIGKLIYPRHLDRSVDVGTCTGRYLAWARKIGVKEINGIDHSPAAIDFCQKHIPFDVTLYLGSCADPATFKNLKNCTLITMMMGTANHLSRTQFESFFLNAAGSSSSDSILIFSTWRVSPMELEIYDCHQVREIEGSLEWVQLFSANSCGFALIDRISTPWLDIWVCEKA